eukprot:6354252-Ditylum_brightwellii.AAC.1
MSETQELMKVYIHTSKFQKWGIPALPKIASVGGELLEPSLDFTVNTPFDEIKKLIDTHLEENNIIYSNYFPGGPFFGCSTKSSFRKALSVPSKRMRAVKTSEWKYYVKKCGVCVTPTPVSIPATDDKE